MGHTSKHAHRERERARARKVAQTSTTLTRATRVRLLLDTTSAAGYAESQPSVGLEAQGP